MSDTWIGLAIGNSRLHWAKFVQGELQHTWHTPHRTNAYHPHDPSPDLYHDPTVPIVMASVVPEQNQYWQSRPNVQVLSLTDIPLQGMYSTLGIDRALAAWGAVQIQGCPALVIDAGTALTFTGIDHDHTLVGGAILPGLRLQFETLGQKTAALPLLTTHAEDSIQLPPRWARTTEAAIASGIFYTLLAGIRSFMNDWWEQFPGSPVMMTGGDSDRLYLLLKQQHANPAQSITLAPDLIFQGMLSVRSRSSSNDFS